MIKATGRDGRVIDPNRMNDNAAFRRRVLRESDVVIGPQWLVLDITIRRPNIAQRRGKFLCMQRLSAVWTPFMNRQKAKSIGDEEPQVNAAGRVSVGFLYAKSHWKTYQFNINGTVAYVPNTTRLRA